LGVFLHAQGLAEVAPGAEEDRANADTANGIGILHALVDSIT
jgi:hypothetical protein